MKPNLVNNPLNNLMYYTYGTMASEIEDASDKMKAGAKATANKASDTDRDMGREYDKEKFKEKFKEKMD